MWYTIFHKGNNSSKNWWKVSKELDIILRRNHQLNVYMGFLLEVNNVLLSCAIQLTCYGFIQLWLHIKPYFRLFLHQGRGLMWLTKEQHIYHSMSTNQRMNHATLELIQVGIQKKHKYKKKESTGKLTKHVIYTLLLFQVVNIRSNHW